MSIVQETSDTGLTADYFAYKDGQVWNGSAYENVIEANIATYRIAATELDVSGVYQADLPDDATFYELREQAATFALSTVRANGSTQAMVQPLTESDGAGGRRLTLAGLAGATLETGYSLANYFRIAFSALAGKSSGHDSNAPVYRDVNDSKDRITATSTTDGRTSVTLDGD